MLLFPLNVYFFMYLFTPLLFGGKDLRMTFSLHLLSCANKIDNGLQLLSIIDVEGMSVLHSASLLFKGITTKRELTDREKRSKRVKRVKKDF